MHKVYYGDDNNETTIFITEAKPFLKLENFVWILIKENYLDIFFNYIIEFLKNK